MSLDEKDLKEKFEGYEVTPSPGTWSRIEQRLNRSRRGFLWLLFFGILGIGVAAGYWGWDQEGNSSEKVEKATVQHDERSLVNNSDSSTKREKPDKNYGAMTDRGKHWEEQQNNANTAESKNNKISPNEKSEPNKTSSKMVAQTSEQKVRVSDDQEQLVNLKQMALLGFQQNEDFQIPNAPLLDSPQYWVDSVADSLLNEEVEKPTSEEKKWQWGIHLMPQITHNAYQDNGVSQQFLRAIEAAESPGKGFSGELNLYYNIGKRFQLLSGIWYTFNQAEFRHKAQEAYTNLGSLEDSDKLSNQFSDNPEPPDDTSDENRVFTNQNQIHRIGIPLLLRYRLMGNEKWQFFATSGFHVNYLLGLNKHIVGHSEDVVYNINEPDNELMRQFNLHCNLRFGIQYELNESWSLAATPSFKAPLFSTYTDKYFLNKHELRFGLGFGFIKDF